MQESIVNIFGVIFIFIAKSRFGQLNFVILFFSTVGLVLLVEPWIGHFKSGWEIKSAIKWFILFTVQEEEK